MARPPLHVPNIGGRDEASEQKVPGPPSSETLSLAGCEGSGLTPRSRHSFMCLFILVYVIKFIGVTLFNKIMLIRLTKSYLV